MNSLPLIKNRAKPCSLQYQQHLWTCPENGVICTLWSQSKYAKNISWIWDKSRGVWFCIATPLTLFSYGLNIKFTSMPSKPPAIFLSFNCKIFGRKGCDYLSISTAPWSPCTGHFSNIKTDTFTIINYLHQERWVMKPRLVLELFFWLTGYCKNKIKSDILKSNSRSNVMFHFQSEYFMSFNIF